MTILKDLAGMTRFFGEPQREFVIIGEGNTSARQDERSFWVKASGQSMASITPEGFVRVQLAPMLDMIAHPPQSREELDSLMQEAVEPSRLVALRPSIEAAFHALLLHLCGVRYVAHTHPISILQVMCSPLAQQFAAERRFPDEVVLCGPESVFVPYADPGIPLAAAMQAPVQAYMEKHGEAPKVLLLENHGLVTLGNSTLEAINLTLMSVKAAQIFLGAAALGAARPLPASEVQHLYRRPDEIYRRRQFAGE